MIIFYFAFFIKMGNAQQRGEADDKEAVVEGESVVKVAGMEMSLAAVRDVWPMVGQHLCLNDLVSFGLSSRAAHFLASEATVRYDCLRISNNCMIVKLVPTHLLFF